MEEPIGRERHICFIRFTLEVWKTQAIIETMDREELPSLCISVLWHIFMLCLDISYTGWSFIRSFVSKVFPDTKS